MQGPRRDPDQLERTINRAWIVVWGLWALWACFYVVWVLFTDMNLFRTISALMWACPLALAHLVTFSFLMIRRWYIGRE
jgi:hypothetical protein